MGSSHYQGVFDPTRTGSQVGNKLIVKPRELDIIWGGDSRYWRFLDKTGTSSVELLQVSWLEVSGSIDLNLFEKGHDYKVLFNVAMKPDAFGFTDNPIYIMAKPGKKGKYIWRNADLGLKKSGESISIPERELKFTVPKDSADNEKLHFGMYEIWRGNWKGGLVINEVVIEHA